MQKYARSAYVERPIADNGETPMKKTILVFGVISGLITIGSSILSHSLGFAEVWLGFLVMFIAFGAIFVAVRQYRDQVLGGTIRFGTALRIGFGISLVASLIYVAVWEVYLQFTGTAFIDTYVQSLVEAYKADGMTGAQLDTAIAEAQAMKAQYANPLFRLPMTLLEIFPVGALISLIAAAVLKSSKVLPAT